MENTGKKGVLPGFANISNEDVLKYHKLVYKIVFEEFFGDELTHDEKMTEGMLGVARALESFDPSRKVTTAHWVAWNVRKNIRDETRRSCRQLRYAKDEESKKALYDVYIRRKENASANTDSKWHDLDEEEKSSIIKDLLTCLNDKERLCVQGIAYGSLTQNELARVLGVSQSRVSRIWRGALKKMRENAGDFDDRFETVQ